MQCDSCDIKNLIYRYADHIDRGKLDDLAALFSGGRLLAVTGDGAVTEIAGEQAILQMYKSFTRLYDDNGTPHTKHVTTNVMVDVAADGATATAQSYAVVFQAVDDFPLQPIIGVRYYDTFANDTLAKDAGGWRFTERKIESHLFGDLSRHLLQPV